MNCQKTTSVVNWTAECPLNVETAHVKAEKIYARALQTAARLRVRSSHVLMVLIMTATVILTAVILTVVQIRHAAVHVHPLIQKKKAHVVQMESIMTVMVLQTAPIRIVRFI